MMMLVGNNRPVEIRPSVAEKLPRIANFADLVHVEIGDYKLVFIARALGD